MVHKVCEVIAVCVNLLLLFRRLLNLWLHKGQLLGWHLWLFVAKKLALTLKQLDLFIGVVPGHGEENRVLKAEWALRNETHLSLLFLLNHRSLLPYLVDDLLPARRQTPIHGSKDNILFFFSLFLRA